jgi:hypothetical protein
MPYKIGTATINNTINFSVVGINLLLDANVDDSIRVNGLDCAIATILTATTGTFQVVPPAAMQGTNLVAQLIVSNAAQYTKELRDAVTASIAKQTAIMEGPIGDLVGVTTVSADLITRTTKADWRAGLELGTAAIVNTGTGATNVPTTAQSDARYPRIDVNNQGLSNAQAENAQVNMHITPTDPEWLAKIAASMPSRLGSATNLSAGIDLNTIVTSGFYRIVSTCTNGPDSGAGNYNTMLVVRGEDTAFQLMGVHGGANGGILFSRGAYGLGSSNTWSPWRQAVDLETGNARYGRISEQNIWTIANYFDAGIYVRGSSNPSITFASNTTGVVSGVVYADAANGMVLYSSPGVAASGRFLQQTIGGVWQVGGSGGGVLHHDGRANRSPSFTVSTVPSASASGAGAQIYVINESAGAVLAFSDGTNWRRVTDRVIIS